MWFSENQRENMTKTHAWKRRRHSLLNFIFLEVIHIENLGMCGGLTWCSMVPIEGHSTHVTKGQEKKWLGFSWGAGKNLIYKNKLCHPWREGVRICALRIFWSFYLIHMVRSIAFSFNFWAILQLKHFIHGYLGHIGGVVNGLHNLGSS